MNVKAEKKDLDVRDESRETEGARHEDGSGISEDFGSDELRNSHLIMTYVMFAGEKEEERRVKAFLMFLNALAGSIKEDETVSMPFIDVNNALNEAFDPDRIRQGDIVQVKQEVRLRVETMFDGNGDEWVPLFLSEEEIYKGQTGNVIMSMSILDVLKAGLLWEGVKGVVINPFGAAFTMTKDLLKKFLDDYEEWATGDEAQKSSGRGADAETDCL